MTTFDNNPNIISWASEEICIPYVSPVDNKVHKYFPDFLVELKNKKGEIDTLLIEVKPSKQTIEPKNTKERKNDKKLFDRSEVLCCKHRKVESSRKSM
jgi:hypothetical protein